MKKQILFLLAALLLLTACGVKMPAQTVDPMASDTTAVQTEPEETQPQLVLPSEGTPLSWEDVARYQQLFSLQYDSYAIHPVNWYNRILLATFDCPENVDLSVLFADGTQRLSGGLTGEEETYLQGKGLDLNMDVVRIPVEEADALLEQYFRLTWDETNKIGTDKMVCGPEGDCWYRISSGGAVSEDFVFLGGSLLEDGTVRLYYRLGGQAELRAITLESRIAEGKVGYRILSNAPVA